MKKTFFKKYALAVSCCLFLIWWILGASATLAWFTDTTPAVRNSFEVGRMNLQVSYKNDNLTYYHPMSETSHVFKEKALYEPGYTQVVYLKIDNMGNIPFDYKVSVDKIASDDSINVFGGTLHLPKYLRFGVMFDVDEATLIRRVAQLEATEEMEGLKLNQYSALSGTTLEPEKTQYAALIVYMPEDIGNEANHIGTKEPPTVTLGVTVFAQQAGTMNSGQ